jgi:hypothetical protein
MKLRRNSGNTPEPSAPVWILRCATHGNTREELISDAIRQAREFDPDAIPVILPDEITVFSSGLRESRLTAVIRVALS